MVQERNAQPFRDSWSAYLTELEIILKRKLTQPNREYLGSLVSFQERVLAELKAPDFIDGLAQAWQQLQGTPGMHIPAELLLEELRLLPAFARAAFADWQGGRSSTGLRLKDLIVVAKTIADSLRELLPLSDVGKAILTIFCELLDLLHGAKDRSDSVVPRLSR